MKQSYRIAYLNPWRLENAAEINEYKSMCIAAKRLGHEVLYCSNSQEINQTNPDFVISASTLQPKLTDHPSFVSIHQPRKHYIEKYDYFLNLVSYDGFLTIMDRSEVFIRDLCHGLKRDCFLGHYYTTCPKDSRVANVKELIAKQKLRITYFAKNGDQGKPDHFAELDHLGILDIYGSQESWHYLTGKSYKGTLLFDSISMQEKHLECGLGLCLLSDDEYADDCISSQIFEICSVGAVAICCDIPWIRENFGDAVYYIDQDLPPEEFGRQLVELLNIINSDPAKAARKAQKGKEIFDAKFSAEIMLRNAVETYERWTHRPKIPPNDPAWQPEIDVIMRCGGRTTDILEQAVATVSQQTIGKYRIIFVRYKPIDLTPILKKEWPNIVGFKIVDCMEGNRSKTLQAGLRVIQLPFFAILDDDDLWMSPHVEYIFQGYNERENLTFFGYSGVMRYQKDPGINLAGNPEWNFITPFGPNKQPKTLVEHIGSLCSNCFVSSTALIDVNDLTDWDLDVGEDTYLELMLMKNATPTFSKRATACVRKLDDGSNYNEHPRLREDLIRLYTRHLSFAQKNCESIISLTDIYKYIKLSFLKYGLSGGNSGPQPKLVDTDFYRVMAVREPVQSALIENTGKLFHLRMEPRFCQFARPETIVEFKNGEIDLRHSPLMESIGVYNFHYQSETEKNFTLIVEVEVLQGTLWLALLGTNVTQFIQKTTLPQYSLCYEVHFPVVDTTETGSLVFANAENKMLHVRVKGIYIHH